MLTCEKCGKEYSVLKIKTEGRRFCSRACYRVEKQRIRRENRHVGGGGYIYLYRKGDPRLEGTQRRYMSEHRLVMEDILGRYLEPWENVHHRDGDRQNNHPDNLELWTVNQPAGQASIYLNEVVKLRRENMKLREELATYRQGQLFTPSA